MFGQGDRETPDLSSQISVHVWRSFASNIYQENKHWVTEFFANTHVVSFSGQVIRIWKNEVHFGAKQTNDIQGLSGFDMTQFEANDCEPGSCPVEKLCPGKEVPQDTTKIGISLHNFIVEAWIWLAIICSWVSPCNNITYVLDMQSRMVECILDNFPLNVGCIMLSNMRHFKNRGGSLLFFSFFDH